MAQAVGYCTQVFVRFTEQTEQGTQIRTIQGVGRAYAFTSNFMGHARLEIEFAGAPSFSLTLPPEVSPEFSIAIVDEIPPEKKQPSRIIQGVNNGQ